MMRTQIAAAVLIVLPLASEHSFAGNIQCKEDVILQRRQENLRRLFPQGVALEEPCTNIPNVEGRGDLAKSPAHLEA